MMAGDWVWILNPAYIAMILLTIIGVIIATSSFKTFIYGCKSVLSTKYEINDVERKNAIGLFKLLSKTIIVMSFLFFLIGMYLMLLHISSLDAEWIIGQVSIGVAISLIGPVNGLFIAVVFFEPAAYILNKPLKRTPGHKEMS